MSSPMTDVEIIIHIHSLDYCFLSMCVGGGGVGVGGWVGGIQCQCGWVDVC